MSDIEKQIQKILSTLSFEQKKRVGDALAVIAQIIQRAIDRNFEQKGRVGNGTGFFDGGNRRWAPLSEDYKKVLQKRKISPLVATLFRKGTLQNTIEVDYFSSQLQIKISSGDGGLVPYAIAHQFGSKNLPARPFIQLNKEDLEDIKDYLLSSLY